MSFSLATWPAVVDFVQLPAKISAPWPSTPAHDALWSAANRDRTKVKNRVGDLEFVLDVRAPLGVEVRSR